MLKFTVTLNKEVIGQTTTFDGAHTVMSEHISDLVRKAYPNRLEVLFFGQTMMDFRCGATKYNYQIDLERVGQ